MRFAELSDVPCSISRALAILGDRWTMVVLKQAFAGTRRFDDFQSALGIARSRLADRLDRLVAEGLLEKREYFDRRTRHEYRLTDKGLAVYPVLMALRAWGDTYLAPDGPPLVYRHRTCTHGEPGTVQVHVTCSGCGEALGPREVTVEAGPGLRETV